MFVKFGGVYWKRSGIIASNGIEMTPDQAPHLCIFWSPVYDSMADSWGTETDEIYVDLIQTTVLCMNKQDISVRTSPRVRGKQCRCSPVP